MKTTEKNLSLIRPNFFPGQMVDYRDFNRLSEQADRVVTLLCRHLFPGGGIVEGAGEGFEVTPMEALKCLIKSGIAVTPAGEMVVLTNEQVVDFTSIQKDLTSPTPVFVSLKNEVRGLDKTIDPQDSSIKGFRSEGYEATLQCSLKRLPRDSVELFRVDLDSSCAAIRDAKRDEEWKAKLSPQSGEAIIDRRFRKVIVPQTFAPLDPLDQVNLRRCLYGIEEAIIKLSRIYVIEDIHGTHQYLTQLHAEVLSRPFQPLKLAFIISEFSDRLSRFLERLSSHVGKSRSNFDLGILHEIVGELDRIKVKEVLPRQAPFKALERVSYALVRLVEFAEQKFNLVHTVRQALNDIQNRVFDFTPNVILGGHLFGRSDLVTASDEALIQLRGKGDFTREVLAKFANGDSLKLLGRFLKEGAVAIQLKISDCTRPVVLVLHEYVRRGGTQVKYEINGKAVAMNLLEGNPMVNGWINRGLVVPAEYLVPQGNELRIVVDRSDLDFGFFDVGVYTPTVYEGILQGEQKGERPKPIAMEKMGKE